MALISPGRSHPSLIVHPMGLDRALNGTTSTTSLKGDPIYEY